MIQVYRMDLNEHIDHGPLLGDLLAWIESNQRVQKDVVAEIGSRMKVAWRVVEVEDVNERDVDEKLERYE
jgi:hypothetical protein